jgi:hypothetical protein
MALGLYLDGNWTTPNQEGPYRIWSDQFTRSRVYAQKVRVLPASWSPIAWGASGPLGGFLVDETQPRLAGPFLEWERIYADLPAKFSRAEMLAYPLQFIITSSSSASFSQSIAEIPINTPVQAIYTYANTPTPWDGASLPITRKYTIVEAGSLFFYIGALVTPPATSIQAADTVISQWKGTIYQAKNLILSIPALTQKT